MTAAQPTALAKERAANGHPDPYQVGFLGIGNESWGCGGSMTADYYLSQLKIYRHSPGTSIRPTRHEPHAQDCRRSGNSGDQLDRDHHESLAASWRDWNIDGLSLHWIHVPNGWPPSIPSTDFSVDDHSKTLKTTLSMEGFLREQEE